MCFSRHKFAWGTIPGCAVCRLFGECVSPNRSSLLGTIPGYAVCRLFGYVWGCVSSNINLFGGTIPAVQFVDCLDTYRGCFSIRLGVQSPAVKSADCFDRYRVRFSK